MHSIYISDIEYSLGALTDIEEIEELKGTVNLDTLRQLGLKTFSKSDSDYELMLNCARRTLKRSGIDPTDIKVVVYSTSSLDDHHSKKKDISKLLCEIGLFNSYPIGIYLSRCTNFSQN